MTDRPQHLDHLFKEWPYVFGEVAARRVAGGDGREVVQLRVDMGVLQMEATGRPDGTRPGGFDTYYDYLVSLAFKDGQAFRLDDERCTQIDREFVQFFHRRICWLALRDFERAVRDADHTLSLMDFSTAHAPSDVWATLHEQYRPFVLFHRTQASALKLLEEMDAAAAVELIDKGVETIRSIFEQHEAEDEFEEDELVLKLREMKESIATHYEVEPSLTEQLANAISTEQYELAAEIRDKIARSRRGKI